MTCRIENAPERVELCCSRKFSELWRGDFRRLVDGQWVLARLTIVWDGYRPMVVATRRTTPPRLPRLRCFIWLFVCSRYLSLAIIRLGFRFMRILRYEWCHGKGCSLLLGSRGCFRRLRAFGEKPTVMENNHDVYVSVVCAPIVFCPAGLFVYGA